MNVVEAVIAAGVVVVAAAGNAAIHACEDGPGAAVSAITVGSTKHDDSWSRFTNYGACVDVYAPGSKIISAWIGSPSDTKELGGTSMAAPRKFEWINTT